MRNLLLYNHALDIPFIQRKVSEVMKIEIEDFNVPNKSPLSRERRITMARQISMKLSREHTSESLFSIGYMHGQRDHATVLHACKAINGLLDVHDKILSQDYFDIEQKVLDYEIMLESLKEKNPQEDNIINTEK